MILANVGLSIFNNWAGSRQNKQIVEKREEFERAAREGQRERMLQLMREGQQLTLELEEQKHKERLSELNDQFDNLIKELAYSAAIEHWPLKTLPIVMKNQALGNLLANQEEKVALHCILTSSNCREFNDYVLPKVESALEAYCNIHWSTLTGSPVLFYSGAWKSNDVPTGTQVDSMRAALSNLPTLLITPFFRPQDHKLVFHVHVWGVGYNDTDYFTIPEIDPSKEPKSEKMEQSDTKRIRFQRDYTDKLKWLAEDGLIEEAVEDLVPYLQCLIGYIADTYFWSAFGSVPQLPRMLTDGTINTDGMKYLVDETSCYYSDLLAKSEEKTLEQPFAADNLLSLYEGTSALWNEDCKNEKLKNIFVTYCNKKSNSVLSGNSSLPLTPIFSYDDLHTLHFINQHLTDSSWKLDKVIEKIENNVPKEYSRTEFPYDLCTQIVTKSIDFISILDEFIIYCKNYKLSDIDLLIKQEYMKNFMFHTYDSKSDHILRFDIPFNRIYKTTDIENARNVNSIFAYGRTKEISCNIKRINILKDKILSSDLTF